MRAQITRILRTQTTILACLKIVQQMVLSVVSPSYRYVLAPAAAGRQKSRIGIAFETAER